MLIRWFPELAAPFEAVERYGDFAVVHPVRSGGKEEWLERIPRRQILSRRATDPWAFLVRIARHKKIEISFAESCTGGLVSASLVAVPGASAVFSGSVVAYANRIKQGLLGVAQETLDRDGAVSSACACQMATGVRSLVGSTFGLAITGIAGPDGGSPHKPVGTVWIALASPAGCRAACFLFEGSRETVRDLARRQSVAILLEGILQYGKDDPDVCRLAPG